MILTHYYHPNDEPFQTLSSLSDADALQVIISLQQRTGAVYQRFRHPVDYLRQRRETEAWLRTEFIKKGGQIFERGFKNKPTMGIFIAIRPFIQIKIIRKIVFKNR